MCALFASTYPERTSALIMYGAMARIAWAPDHPWGRTLEEQEARLKAVEQTWGTGAALPGFSPSLVDDDSYRKWWATFECASASPGAVLAVYRMNWEIDARHVLPAINVPTLVLHRTGDLVVKVEHGRYIAEHIPGAKYVELPGPDHAPWAGDAEALVGRRARRVPDRRTPWPRAGSCARHGAVHGHRPRDGARRRARRSPVAGSARPASRSRSRGAQEIPRPRDRHGRRRLPRRVRPRSMVQRAPCGAPAP